MTEAPIVLYEPDEASPLERLVQARQLLAEARAVDEVLHIRDYAVAARVYAQQARLGLDALNFAAEIKLRAERRAGELFAQIPREQGFASADMASTGAPAQATATVTAFPGTTAHSAQPEHNAAPVLRTPYQEALEAAQVPPSTARRWQRIALVPEAVFEQHVEDTRARGGEITTAGVVKLAPRPPYHPTAIAPIDPARLGPRDRFDTIDAAELAALWPAGSVDLLVTSPPYAVDKPYLGGDVPTYQDWVVAMGTWLTALFQVANAEHGRLCLNVPLDRDLGGWQPVSADVLVIARARGWQFRTWIIWEDGQAGAGTDRGSLDSASAPNVTAPVESILVLYRGAWRTPGPMGTSHEDWLELCGPRGLWRFPGVQGDTLAPAPFSEELPRRCISVYSHPGAVVADPFCGRGTTPAVAARLGRVAWAADRNPACVAAASAWVARERQNLGAGGY